MFFLMITLEYFSARVSREMILYPSALHTKTCVLLLRGFTMSPKSVRFCLHRFNGNYSIAMTGRRRTLTPCLAFSHNVSTEAHRGPHVHWLAYSQIQISAETLLSELASKGKGLNVTKAHSGPRIHNPRSPEGPRGPAADPQHGPHSGLYIVLFISVNIGP